MTDPESRRKPLSVIYGDIGTSPLYVFTGIFPEPPTDSRDVFGALSLIVWSLTIVVLIKYVFIVLRADDYGEGGTFALYSLLSRHSGISVRGNVNSDEDLTTIKHEDSIPIDSEGPNFIKRSIGAQTALLGVVLLGSSLVMSDGLLTPAISVISAVEGMAVIAPNLTPAIVPISCVIIVVLFLLQQFGTGKVGNLFAPIVSLWFIALASIGIWNISQNPDILRAYSPYFAFDYFIRKQDAGFTDLGGVLLAVTGVEALFADLGHFSHTAIRISFPFFVYIPLVLAYTGQAARLVLDPTVISNTFWLTIPSDPGIYWTVFVLAILATIIASQAMISATFSLIYQSMQLDCLPRVKVVHTSEKVEGQIYIPEINYILMVVIVFVCIGFQHSANLTIAYGVAVASVMIITTTLLTIVIRVVWHRPIIISIIFFCIFFTVDASFLGATLRKVVSGGWFTLSVAILLTILMSIWRWGTVRVLEHERSQTPDLNKLFKDEKNRINEKIESNINNASHEIILENNNEIILEGDNENISINTGTHLTRSPGIGLFYSDIGAKIPLSFTQFVKHFPVMPQNVVFINIRTIADPKVGNSDRLRVKKIKNCEGCYQVTARYGYTEQVSQGKEFLLQLVEAIRNIDPTNKTLIHDFNPDNGSIAYVVGQQSLCAKPDTPWWTRILINIYMVIYLNTRKFYSNWDIPVENTIEVGVKISI
ncbi:7306_t:CDS:10 [Dentiscutata heterogama]|uniref:7306_t:CDS:1 n=1 Tax=Dentiscutata heterogama TaxID=1316150 RepID=A0ACA9KSX7_9GLOM|nr:7306_t:CDS:10 [Dentiscutata heterogama]